MDSCDRCHILSIVDRQAMMNEFIIREFGNGNSERIWRISEFIFLINYVTHLLNFIQQFILGIYQRRNICACRKTRDRVSVGFFFPVRGCFSRFGWSNLKRRLDARDKRYDAKHNSMIHSRACAPFRRTSELRRGVRFRTCFPRLRDTAKRVGTS